MYGIPPPPPFLVCSSALSLDRDVSERAIRHVPKKSRTDGNDEEKESWDPQVRTRQRNYAVEFSEFLQQQLRQRLVLIC